MATSDVIDDLAADVLAAASPLEAQDLLASQDRLTAARVGVLLAVLVRTGDRGRLPGLVSALREAAAADREVAALDELWRLSEGEP